MHNITNNRFRERRHKYLLAILNIEIEQVSDSKCFCDHPPKVIGSFIYCYFKYYIEIAPENIYVNDGMA